MERPLADKRPIGPFAKPISSFNAEGESLIFGGGNVVLFTTLEKDVYGPDEVEQFIATVKNISNTSITMTQFYHLRDEIAIFIEEDKVDLDEIDELVKLIESTVGPSNIEKHSVGFASVDGD